ncbi:hypothetical protein [Cystobacter fuscus]|nr:hypothetical protein [Cystobacter fuscus]
MYPEKTKGTNKNYVEYSTFKVFEDDPDFQIGATGAGLTMNTSTIIQRKAHSFRTADLALNRILTYLAENMLSYLNEQNFVGLAEVQIGWISVLNTLLITENNVTEFNTKISGMDGDDLLGIMKKKGTSKLKTQGIADYFDHRMKRHDDKLKELLSETGVRYNDWVKLDKNVQPLINFLTNSCEGVYILKHNRVNTYNDIANKIVHYEAGFGFKGPTKHAELYHLEVFDQIAKAAGLMSTDAPKYYVAGTKRACSTCAGVLEEYKNKPHLTGKLFADHEHPGNLWTAQNINQSDQAAANTLQNLEDKKIHITKYTKRTKRTTKTYMTSGFNSDSESENEFD